MHIGWFSTGRDEEALRLLDEVIRRRDELGVSIAFLFCNREYGESLITDRLLSYASSMGLKTITLSSSRFRPDLRKLDIGLWREEYHKAVWEKIESVLSGEVRVVDFSFLAGYMLIVGRSLIERHLMLNLHPAPPKGPKGSWQDVMWELIEKEAQEAGAQIHIVTPELDEGPPVSFCRFSIRGAEYEPLWNKLREDLKSMSLDEIKRRYGEGYPLFKKIRQEEFIREIPLILLTLKRLSEIKREATVTSPLAGGLKFYKGGIDLSDEVNEYIRTHSL